MATCKCLIARILFLNLLIFSVLAGCDSNSSAPPRGSNSSNMPAKRQQVSVRLQWFPMAQFAGIYTAAAKGYYKDAGLDLTINPGGPDFNAITLVTNGSDTFGTWTADQLLISSSKGIPVKIVAVIYRKDPNVLMVRNNSPIKGPKDFVGKTVTTVYGRATESVLMAMLSRAGVNPKSVNVEPFPFNLQSFAAGKVDVSAGYVFDHPYQARKMGIDIKIIDPADFGVSFYSDCLFVRRELIESNPELVRRFVHATLKGWEDSLKNKAQAVDMLLNQTTGLDRESQMFMLEQAEPLIRHEDAVRIGLVSAKSLDAMKAILVDQKQMPADFDVNSVFDNRFVETYFAARKP